MKEIKQTILIIEDDAGLSELLNEKIESCGYETICFLNAGSALDWIKVNVPFLIVLDYGLPDMNGNEFIAELIKIDSVLPPFVVSTGQGDERIAVEMMKLGARDYLVKDSHFLDMIPLIICKVCGEIEKENKLSSTEKALTESTQFNNHIINSAHEGIIVSDMNRNCQVWNHYMEQLSGMPAFEVLGNKTIELFQFLQNNDYVNQFENAFSGIVSKELEFYFEIPSTGKSGWVSETISTLRNTDNEIIGVLSLVRDITERKQAEQKLQESEYRLRTIIDNEPECIKIIDENGLLTMMNPAGLAMIEADSLEQVIGKSVLSIIAPEYQNDFVNAHKRVLKGQSVRIEFEMIGLKGRRRWLETNAVPLQSEGKIVQLAITRDITDRKQAEQELNDKMDELMYFHRLTVGRELTMIELKKEVNQLLIDAGQESKYNIVG